MNCEEVVALAPELALEVADGVERDASLRHLASCASCRHLVWSSRRWPTISCCSRPSTSRPRGSIPACSTRWTWPRDQRRRPSRSRAARAAPASRRVWTKPLAVAASFVLAIAVGAGAMFAVTAGDRRVAGDYQALLGVGHGSFFAAAPLLAGARGGRHRVGLRRRPVVGVRLNALPDRRDQIVPGMAPHVRRPARLARARRARPRLVVVGDRNLPVDLATVRELWFEPVDSGPGLVAMFHPDDPWSRLIRPGDASSSSARRTWFSGRCSGGRCARSRARRTTCSACTGRSPCHADRRA